MYCLENVTLENRKIQVAKVPKLQPSNLGDILNIFSKIIPHLLDIRQADGV